jgi:ABC-2 type transport system ATP-binding protein
VNTPIESPALRLREVSRRFGDRQALDAVSLDVAYGQIVCLLGHNGAGKTTTVRIASTLLTPHAGSVVVDGIDAVVRPRAARARTGLVLGGERGFYTRPSVSANLLFYADVAGVPARQRRRRVEQALGAVGLTERASSPVGELSRGMVQRLHLARALLSEPGLLILDEPSSGLDVQSARDLRELVRARANAGVGVLLTTHTMPEAEALADRVDVIRRGRIIVSGDTSTIAHAAGVHAVTTVLVATTDRDLAPELAAVPNVVTVGSTAMHGRTAYTVMWSGEPDHVALQRIYPPDADVITRQPTLEESYLALEDGR